MELENSREHAGTINSVIASHGDRFSFAKKSKHLIFYFIGVPDKTY
jgi:hypothetical protein